MAIATTTNKLFTRKRWIKLLLLAIVVYLVALIMLFPARIAWQWFGEDMATATPIQLSGIKGTIWHGSANQLQTEAVTLTELKWDWRASDLLQLGLGANVSADAGAGPFSASITQYGEQDFDVANALGEIPLELLLTSSPYAAYLNDGVISVDVEHIEIRDGLPTSASGALRASNLSIGLMRPPAPLGDYLILLSPADATQGDLAITAQINDDHFNVEATLLKTDIQLTVDQQGCYQALGYAEPTPQFDARLGRLMGPLNAQGQIPVDLNDCLNESPNESANTASPPA